MKTFYLEQKTADCFVHPEIVPRRRMSSILTRPRSPIPDFIPVTPAEVQRKSLENAALLARFKYALNTRKKMSLVALSAKESKPMANMFDATNRDSLSKDEKIESSTSSRRSTVAGRQSPHYATERPEQQGKSATSDGLYERLNAALSARRQTVDSVDSRRSSLASRESVRARSCALL